MTLSLRRAVTTVAVAAGLTLAAAGPATAQQLTVKDARGDVRVSDMMEEADSAGTPAPEVTNGDVLRTVFRHNRGRVVVRVKFADLQRRGMASVHIVRVVTNEKMIREVTVGAAPGLWRGQAEMTRPNGNTVACDVRHSINYGTNVLFMSFPRSCVSNPRWVRLGLGSAWITADMKQMYLDDAQISHAMKPHIRLTPRLRRG